MDTGFRGNRNHCGGTHSSIVLVSSEIQPIPFKRSYSHLDLLFCLLVLFVGPVMHACCNFARDRRIDGEAPTQLYSCEERCNMSGASGELLYQ